MRESFGVPELPQDEKEIWGEKAELNAEIARIAGNAHGSLEKELEVVGRVLGYREDSGEDYKPENYHLSHDTLIEYFHKIAERAQKAAEELEGIKEG